GKYFQHYPGHILGTEMGTAGDDDDQTAKPRWGYQVEGEFTALPALVERPMCSACTVVQRARSGAKRSPERRPEAPERDPRLAAASSLGHRVGSFLAAVAAQENEIPALAWRELHQGLVDWSAAHGAPSLDVELIKLAKGGDVGAQRFLAAYE